MSTRTLNTNTVIGGFMAVFGLAAIVASLDINTDPDGAWGARIFPLVGSVALVVLGVVECVNGLKFPPPAAERGAEDNVTGRILALLILSFAYVWLIGKFGYLLSTGLAAIGALMIFGVRNPVGLLVAAIVCPAIYHLIFFVLLGVFPPYGEWFDPLDITQGY
ncbi:tripartite tricarboxylate transporter TctB family protein [Falsiruegeria mediterranea]|jgi:putative tricarboxylic transport membrane protein